MLVFSLFMIAGIEMLKRTQLERSLESRHPLSSRSTATSGVIASLRKKLSTAARRTRRMKENVEPIRLVSFGSSSTWGADLETPEQDAYPYRILLPAANPSSTRSLGDIPPRNVAMRGGGGVLPAACTQSIVGNELYDVVTIEFTTFDESYAILARRLRRRFPYATIVFVQLWNPTHVTYTVANRTTIDLPTWMRDRKNLSLHSIELPMSILEADPETKWSVVIHRNEQDEARLRRSMAEVNASLVPLPTPTSTDFAFPQNLRGFFEYFREEATHHLSKNGHAAIAEGVKRAVNAQAILNTYQAERDATGSWGSGDRCNLWYFNGQYEEASTGASRLGFSHSGSEHKHALEFRRYGEGTLKVTNPFSEDRLLYLTYMTASDEEDNKIYPRTRVRLNGRPSVLVDPFHDGEGGPATQRHLTRTSAVGIIPPGETVVHLDPQEQSLHHFRLVGASILSDEASKVLPIDFTLEPEPANEDLSFWRQMVL